jgi:hypothetical protein
VHKIDVWMTRMIDVCSQCRPHAVALLVTEASTAVYGDVVWMRVVYQSNIMRRFMNFKPCLFNSNCCASFLTTAGFESALGSSLRTFASAPGQEQPSPEAGKVLTSFHGSQPSQWDHQTSFATNHTSSKGTFDISLRAEANKLPLPAVSHFSKQVGLFCLHILGLH